MNQPELHTETVDSHTFDQEELQNLEIPVLTILGHPDVERVGDRVPLNAILAGKEVPLSRLEPEFKAPGQYRGRPLADKHLSRKPFVLTRGPEQGSIRWSNESTKTSLRVDGNKVGDAPVFSSERIREGVVFELGRRIVLLLHFRPPMIQEAPRFGLIGESPEMARVRRDIKLLAELDVPVLLRGETGTGKELVARAIHSRSPMRHGPWVSVNMAAIPADLAASELFGAAKGAYTGADRNKEGYFERAHEGTLLLDEIGEMSTEIQVLLLRALESGEIQPVGSAKTREVRARVIAATDADLEQAIEEDRFRAPLLHRLARYQVRIPPLRERREDFGRLFFHFLGEELREISRFGRLMENENPWPPARLVAILACYDWPGNVRQLRNVAGRLALIDPDNEMEAFTLIEELLGISTMVTSLPKTRPRMEKVLGMSDSGDLLNAPTAEIPTEESSDDVTTIVSGYRKPSRVEEDELLTALRENFWEIKPTADALGISRASLYVLIERCAQVRKASELTRKEIEQAQEKTGGDPKSMVLELEVSRQGLRRRMTALGME